MKIFYVCGYGRSGSTLLGGVLAAERHGIAVGEVHQMLSRSFLSTAVCACGSAYPTCAFWRRVDMQLAATRRPGAGPGTRWTVAAESYLGLLIPMPALRRIVARVPFSGRYPGVSYRDGVRALVVAGNGPVVDTSKTTRLTGNRPRMLRASGADLELVLAQRPWAEVAASYRSAGLRRGRARSAVRAYLATFAGRLLARLAAQRCARSLRARVARVDLDDTVARSHRVGEALEAAQHSIAGNRGRLKQVDSA